MDKSNKTKVLVTGGGGFIGKHLIHVLLDKGYEVSCLDKEEKSLPSGIKFILGDVTDQESVEKAMKGQNFVFHLAGILGTSELQYKAVEATQINVIGSLRVFNEAIKNNTKVVLISKPNPWLNTYSITKEASEKFCQMYCRDFSMKAVIIKWFNLYGPGQKHYGVQKAVPTFIINALQGKPLQVYGSGKQTADFIYVTDAVETTIEVAENPKSEGMVIQIGTGEGTRVSDLAEMVIKLSNSSSMIEHLPMRIGEDEYTEVVADLAQLRQIYNFRAKVSLESGLLKTIDFYRNLLKETDKKLRN